MIHNRSRNQLREKGDKQRIIQKTALPDFPPVSVHKKTNLLEGKKTDSQRKQDSLQQKRSTKYDIYIFNKKVKILEIKKNSQIAQNTRRHHYTAPVWPRCIYQPKANIIKKNTENHNQQIAGIKIPIKPQRKACQPQLGRHRLPPMGEQIKPAQAKW